MESICLEAERITNGARREAYGHPLDNFRLEMDLIQPIISKCRGELTPAIMGLIKIQIKIAREMHCHQRDNIVDIAGYANTIGMIYDRLEREERETDQLIHGGTFVGSGG